MIGTGIDGYIEQVTTTFPNRISNQSVTGMFLVAGSKTPTDAGDMMRALGKLFGNKEFVRVANAMRAIGPEIAADLAEIKATLNGLKVEDGKLLEPAPAGWGWNGPISLPSLVPPVGGLFAQLHKAVSALVPPPSFQKGQEAIIAAIRAKLQEITRVITEIMAMIDIVVAILQGLGDNLYVLFLTENSMVTTPSGSTVPVPTPLGWDTTGSAVSGSNAAGKIRQAMTGAVWETGTGENQFSPDPPEALTGNAMVIGLGLIATTGQLPTPGSLLSGSAASAFGNSEPSAMQIINGLFGVDFEQVSSDFGAIQQNLDELSATLQSTTAP
tara:strand:+ start:1 stop:981 length:981 start_codon:yes stop_codon:yes gene_type:complete